MLEPQALLDEVGRTGYVILKKYFPEEALRPLEQEAEWLLKNPRSWNKTKIDDHSEYATISPPTIPESEAGPIQNIVKTFSAPFFVDLSRTYLQKPAYVSHFIINREKAHAVPITMWHADQQSAGLRSFKYMVYFTDATARTGAFSYVPGSLQWVLKVTREAMRRGQPTSQVHTFEQLRQKAVEFNFHDCVEAFDAMSKHIQGDYESDNRYSLEAERGSMIVFDPKGVHRGGVVSEKERFLLRVHCYEPYPKPWKSRLKDMVLGSNRAEDFIPLGTQMGDAREPAKEYG